jgi:RND superfamily putative drug exporter
VDAYLVVTLFGIGTDYCLFMVSRFKEELIQNDHRGAGEMALKRIGPVILASAAHRDCGPAVPGHLTVR